jgi:hypothetical protein
MLPMLPLPKTLPLRATLVWRVFLRQLKISTTINESNKCPETLAMKEKRDGCNKT